jgi:hypothetical protein
MPTNSRRKTAPRPPLDLNPFPQLPPQLLPWERDLLLVAFARLLSAAPTLAPEASDAPSA